MIIGKYLKSNLICVLALFCGFAYSSTGTWKTVDMPGANYTRVTGIDGGNLVGNADAPNCYNFLYDGSNWTCLAMPSPLVHHIELRGIDDSNIVGSYYFSNRIHGFIYNIDDESFVTLDNPEANDTYPYGIDGNNIVGLYWDGSFCHGFLFDSTNWTTLDAPGALNTYAYGIDGNNIVGSFDDSSGSHGFFYDGTTWTTLDAPGAGFTVATDIDGNNIVGFCEIARGFLYSISSSSWKTLVMPGAYFTRPYGIDDISVVGETINGQSFIYTISRPSQTPFCSEQILGDLNGDCKVDFEDFAIIASHWLQRSSVLIASFSFDTNQNWTTEGEWRFGTPMGMGGSSFGYPDPNQGFTGQNVYGVNLNGDYDLDVGGPYRLTSGPFNCSQYERIELSFARWLNTDTSYYVKCTVEVSINGSDWQEVWVNPADTEIADNQWQQQNFDISSIARRQPTVYLRWSYQIVNDRAYPYSGWNIDDVELQGLID